MRWKPYLIGVLSGGLIVGAFLVLIAMSIVGRSVSPFQWGGIAVIEVDGGIYVADEIVEQIEEARTADHVKGVVLRVNSPGGSVGASQEIYHALLELKKAKPVVTSMGDVAASGGYYIACATQQIFAMPGTITGSIGVRMSHVNAVSLLRWIGIAPETLKSGAFKDAGSAIRDMTAAEREFFQRLLADMHEQFKEAVASGRSLSREAVEAFADGRILTGRQAVALKLVDRFGGLPEAVKAVAATAGITGEPRIVNLTPTRPWWVDFLWEDTGGLLRRFGGVLHSGWRGAPIGYWAY